MIIRIPLIPNSNQASRVDFFDKKEAHAGSVTSKYAKYTKTNNLWELRDSVVVVNDKNDKLETELLFWNQESD